MNITDNIMRLLDDLIDHEPLDSPEYVADDELSKALNIIVDQFVLENDLGYQQQSEKWRTKRTRTIGGSEQAVIEGKDKYKNITKLIASKLGIEPFTTSIITQWGNLFEDVLCEYIETALGTKIKATEAFFKGRFVTQTYSPDGIGVVRMKKDAYGKLTLWNNKVINGHNIVHSLKHEDANSIVNIDNNIADSKPTIVLFEFKCPFSRIPDGSIPVQYKPQIMAGMDTCRICEAAVFVEAIFRRCRFDALGMNLEHDSTLMPNGITELNTNSKYQTGLEDKSTLNKPLAYGIVKMRFDSRGFSFNANKALGYLNDLQQQYILCGYGLPGEKFVDLGSASKNILEIIMNLFSCKVLVPDSVVCYDESDLGSIQKFKEDFNNNSANGIIYGVMPYKLLSLWYNYENKVEGYLDAWKDKIDETIHRIEYLETHPDEKAKFARDYLGTQKSGDEYKQSNNKHLLKLLQKRNASAPVAETSVP